VGKASQAAKGDRRHKQEVIGGEGGGPRGGIGGMEDTLGAA